MGLHVVDVFFADLRGQDCEALASRLDPESLQRLGKITHWQRRAQFILGRVLLLEALRHLYGTRPWHLEVAAGRPSLVGADAPWISIAHARELVACAIAEVPLGLDVEYRRPRNYVEALEWLDGNGALDGFAALPEAAQEKRFYAAWTLWEATFKLRSAVGEARSGKRLRHVHFQPHPGFLAAVVADCDDEFRVKVHHLVQVSDSGVESARIFAVSDGDGAVHGLEEAGFGKVAVEAGENFGGEVEF